MKDERCWYSIKLSAEVVKIPNITIGREPLAALLECLFQLLICSIENGSVGFVCIRALFYPQPVISNVHFDCLLKMKHQIKIKIKINKRIQTRNDKTQPNIWSIIFELGSSCRKIELARTTIVVSISHLVVARNTCEPLFVVLILLIVLSNQIKCKWKKKIIIIKIRNRTTSKSMFSERK